jgi:hypothetical protein
MESKTRAALALWSCCAGPLFLAGCGEYGPGSQILPPVDSVPAAHAAIDSEPGSANPDREKAVVAVPPEVVTSASASQAAESGAAPVSESVATATTERAGDGAPAAGSVPKRERTFAIEGSERALRISYDDLDLLKILRMDPVTTDCVDKMPGWLRGLDGKKVRIRGFMKPGLVLTDIPQFMQVRDTGLCCFGPKGKIHDMIAVTLRDGTTTDYIELRPFDVIGTFRIALDALDDGTVFRLYFIDDAVIAEK